MSDFVLTRELTFHRWVKSTKNDVGIPCKKVGNKYKIFCSCGCIITTEDNPVGKILLCDINEEEYTIV